MPPIFRVEGGRWQVLWLTTSAVQFAEELDGLVAVQIRGFFAALRMTG